jgi:hypothetical protein
MGNVLRWFTRGVHNLYGGAADEDARGTFEHVDSARLDASGFCASGSMGLRDLPALNLLDGRPRFRPPPASHRRRATTRVGRGFA